MEFSILVWGGVGNLSFSILKSCGKLPNSSKYAKKLFSPIWNHFVYFYFSIQGGVCKNNAGSYSCDSCSVTGTKLSGVFGTFVSHSGFDAGTSKYSANTDKQWYIKVQGINVDIRIIQRFPRCL